MSDENEQAPERVSLFSSHRNNVRDDSGNQTALSPAHNTSEENAEEAQTVVLSPYDPPVEKPQPQEQASLDETQVIDAAQPIGVDGSVEEIQPLTSPAMPLHDVQELGKEEKKAQKAEEKALRRQNGREGTKKKALIGAGIAAGVLAVIYFAGVLVYSGRFFPHTSFGALDVSNTTFEDATTLIETAEKDYSLTVAGRGLDFTVTPAESGMDIDAKQIVNAARKKVNPWSWPVQLFKQHNLVESAEVTLDDSTLGGYVLDQINAFNETQPASENARIEYDTAAGSFAIVPEVYGEQFDGDKVVSKVTSCIFQQAKKCTLSADELLKPTAHADDKNVVAGAKAANNMLGVNAEFASPVANGVLGTLDSALLSQWITFDKNFKPSVNQEALSAWAIEMVRPLSTVGVTRSYTRADGKQVTVRGGTFGCSVSNDDAVAAVQKAVDDKTKGKVTVERTCAGTQAAEGSPTEWGAYVDVDLSEQHARYYDTSGNIVWESGVVSGNVSEGHSTPTGVYYVNNKQRNQTLRGPRDANGEPEWESDVSYWMPFIGNAVGLHDATWRGAGEFSDPGRYRIAGSHGCVNLPLSAAASLYSVLPVGTPVIVHN